MKTVALCALMLFAGSASAASLDVPHIKLNRTVIADYRCPNGQHFSVTYLNADNGQSFAVMPYRGSSMLLVSTLSADGVKYQADSLTWWIKGRGGTLSDVRIHADKPVLEGCTSK